MPIALLLCSQSIEENIFDIMTRDPNAPGQPSEGQPFDVPTLG
jgi:hypothetical protein